MNITSILGWLRLCRQGLKIHLSQDEWWERTNPYSSYNHNIITTIKVGFYVSHLLSLGDWRWCLCSRSGLRSILLCFLLLRLRFTASWSSPWCIMSMCCAGSTMLACGWWTFSLENQRQFILQDEDMHRILSRSDWSKSRKLILANFDSWISML